MEPQITQNTLTDTGEDGVGLLTRRFIGCALMVPQGSRRDSSRAVSATGLYLCPLLNFGKPRLAIKGIVLAL